MSLYATSSTAPTIVVSDKTGRPDNEEYYICEDVYHPFVIPILSELIEVQGCLKYVLVDVVKKSKLFQVQEACAYVELLEVRFSTYRCDFDGDQIPVYVIVHKHVLTEMIQRRQTNGR